MNRQGFYEQMRIIQTFYQSKLQFNQIFIFFIQHTKKHQTYIMDRQQKKQTAEQVVQNNPTNNSISQNQTNNIFQTQQTQPSTTTGVQIPTNVQQDEQDWQSFGSGRAQGDFSENVQINIQQALQRFQGQQPQSDQQYMAEQSQQISNQIQQQKLGCQHYQRNCSVQAPCCKIFYSCKLCHDEKYAGPKAPGCKIERMAFDQVKNIKCLKCQKIQPASQKCTNPQCQIRFGEYACLKCMLYQNKPSKVNDIFHCDQCRMCRRGKVQNHFHCKKCGYCRPRVQYNNHKCTQNAGDSKCPVCLDVLKFSTKYYTSLPCGHLIHQACLQQYNNINCPVCGMAMQKISDQRNKQIDLLIQQTKANLPKQLVDKKVDILCNECLHKSYQKPFHFFGVKCQKCGTYNTKMI